ncbi:fibronectin type III domain-containing protein [Bacillus toyonensis]|uniref:fibronectin type III domain-containing protein n=1 Tax=Bacillus toyonensis TaxID=155322 RepID=UPI0021CE07A8|nr:fibronectin type III domain-containing protein [Bacillus toyonensis]MCU5727982.1 fibronectin type III domain-containing protein [Bacillus toyonensis]
MFFKKCILMLSLVVVTVLSIPSFASADSYLQPVKNNDDFILVQSYQYGTKEAINQKYQSLDSKADFVVDLGKSLNLNSIKLHTFNASNNNYRGAEIRFFNSEGKMLLGYSLEQLTYFDKDYYHFSNTIKGARYVRFTFNSVTGDGLLFYEFLVSETSKGKTGVFPPKGSNAVLPNDVGVDDSVLQMDEINDLNAFEDVNDVTFNWKNPSVSEFSGVKIFNGNSLVATLNKDVKSYKVEGLEADKNYNFKFVAMYGDKKSKGIAKVIKTKEKPKGPMPLVKPPEKVFLTPQNGSLVINWESVNSEFLKGYNVYVEGKKVNNELLTSNKLILNNLENDKKYSVQISAVNLENKEGNKSAAVTESPSKNSTTIEYDLKPPLTAMEFLETSGTIVMWLSPFILIGIVVIWFKPLKDLIVKAVLDHKKKGEKK